MTCFVLANSTACKCHGCPRWIERDVHYCEHVLWCAGCCPVHRPAEPLPDREVETLAGEQETLFEGADSLRERGGG